MHWRVTSEIGHEQRRALVVDDPLVELEEVRSPARDVEPVVLQLHRRLVERVLLLERLVAGRTASP